MQDEGEPRFGIEIGSSRIGLGLSVQVAAAWFSSPETLQAGAHEPMQNGLILREAEFGMFGEVDRFIEVACSVGFSAAHVAIEEGYAATRRLPFGFRLRGGLFQTRFGLDNPLHPQHFAFIDRPFAITRIFGSVGNRGMGVEVSYAPPFVEGLELIATAAGAGGVGTMRSFYGGTDLGIQTFRHILWVGGVRHSFSFLRDFRLGSGVSGAFGPNATGRDNHTDVYGADVKLSYGSGHVPKLTLAVEAFHRRRQVPQDVIRDNGGYAWIRWRFLESWAVGTRYDVGTPFSSYNGRTLFDPLDPTWTRTRHRLSLNLHYHLTDLSSLMAQGSRDIDGPYVTPGGQSLGQHWAFFLGGTFQLGLHDLSHTHEH